MSRLCESGDKMSAVQNCSTNSVARKPNYWLIWEITCNIFLAVFFLRFVLNNVSDLSVAFRLSSLLMLLKVSADTSFHLVRSPAKKISTNLWDWIIGIIGAFTILFFHSIKGADMLLGTGLQLVGMALQVAAMISLNRSIGFVAANRGVKTKGMYRFVRHPLYFAYVVAFLGYLINHFSAHNIVIYLLMVICLYLRTRSEEGVLTQDETYREYKSRVRWRMIPGIL
jgi:protein-S-isoprenylcysteine O-methyltransferase Ste14